MPQTMPGTMGLPNAMYLKTECIQGSIVYKLVAWAAAVSFNLFRRPHWKLKYRQGIKGYTTQYESNVSTLRLD